MRLIRTEIDIDAPPAMVWDVLTDVAAYGEWNPHVRSVRGDLRVGESLDILVRRAGTRDRWMSVTVTSLAPAKTLEWVGRVGGPWLFEGRHTLTLEPLDGDRTHLVNSERLSGLFVPLVVTSAPERDYEAMNRALKARVEG